MISKNVKVEVALREEDRPIAFLVQMASQFESKILFETGNKQVNVKSMMGMMSLGLDLDRLEDLTVVADGVDEEEAISKIEYYLTKGAHTLLCRLRQRHVPAAIPDGQAQAGLLYLRKLQETHRRLHSALYPH